MSKSKKYAKKEDGDEEYLVVDQFDHRFLLQKCLSLSPIMSPALIWISYANVFSDQMNDGPIANYCKMQ